MSIRLCLAANHYEEFAQAKVVNIEMNLRLELPGLRCFQFALQVFADARWDLERNFMLQPEAAVHASAKSVADNADGVQCRIVNAKADGVHADRQRGELAVRLVDGCAGSIVEKEITVA